MKNKMYLYQSQKIIAVDLPARKYRFIEELMEVEEESTMEALERVLKEENEALKEVSSAHKNELNRRLKTYQDNPQDLLDWQEVKNDW